MSLTRADLASRSEAELHGLLKKAFNACVATPIGSERHRQAQADIVAIKNALIALTR